MADIYLQPGRDKPVRQRHPWVFSGAIARAAGDPAPGDVVEVLTNAGEWLARGYYNPRSQIVVRILTWDAGERIDDEFWRRRLAAAGEARARLGFGDETTAYRLVHAESDGLPGFVVDRYGDRLVCQFLTLGVEQRRETLLALLQELFSPVGIVDRSDVAVRKQEGLALRSGLAAGTMPAEDFEVRENGLRFQVDLLGGQKTGFYIDQRENRSVVRRWSTGARILNAFSFTGAFGVYALAGGAQHVTNIDASLDALEGAEQSLGLNGFDPDEQADAICGDVFQVLRDLWRAGQRYDLVVLDPPKFARNAAELQGATRGYKDINLSGMRLLRPGGLLVTFSCSGLVTPDLFQKIVFGASVDAGRDVQVLAKLGQGADHPLLLSFPEGEYLKGLLCRVA